MEGIVQMTTKLMTDYEGPTKVEILGGDIRPVEADALITAINSGKMWFGGIDGAIQSVAGNMFHEQAAREQLSNLKTVVARGGKHRGGFKNVVFVVDDLKSPLRLVIMAGLAAADNAGFATVSIPGIRLGVMLGIVEKTLEEAYAEMNAGVLQYLESNENRNIRHIKFVLRD
jgi:O-acetyl-ADP-ribose deacetylase (regulator of RNase III)